MTANTFINKPGYKKTGRIIPCEPGFVYADIVSGGARREQRGVSA